MRTIQHRGAAHPILTERDRACPSPMATPSPGSPSRWRCVALLFAGAAADCPTPPSPSGRQADLHGLGRRDELGHRRCRGTGAQALGSSGAPCSSDHDDHHEAGHDHHHEGGKASTPPRPPRRRHRPVLVERAGQRTRWAEEHERGCSLGRRRHGRPAATGAAATGGVRHGRGLGRLDDRPRQRRHVQRSDRRRVLRRAADDGRLAGLRQLARRPQRAPRPRLHRGRRLRTRRPASPTSNKR